MYFSWPHCAACGILFPDLGLNLTALNESAESDWTAKKSQDNIFF